MNVEVAVALLAFREAGQMARNECGKRSANLSLRLRLNRNSSFRLRFTLN